MLVPLSKLASKSTFLLSEQVDLLLLYLSQDKTLRLQATALRCLHLIFVRGACQSSVSSHAIKTLLRAADDINLPSTLQCEALQILHKMLLVRLPNMPYDNFPEFAHLLTIVENSIQSATTSKTLTAFGILVDVSRKLHGRTEIYSPSDCSSLQMQIISMIIDQIILLIKPLMDLCQTNTRIFQEVRSLLNLLLILVRENPELGVLVLDQVRLVIEHLVDEHESVMAVRQENISICGVPDCNGEESKAMVMKMLYNVCIFSVIFIENLYEVNAVTAQILDKVKLLVESVHQFSLFACYTQIIYSILLHSQSFWGCVINQDWAACNLEMHWENSICNHLVGYEAFTVECAKKMLG
uniref:Uncharacterized protein LOC105647182 isoform X1 n=1 Tax=Rhizophora mucronata TaxID=61149 RepID=A0A2P2MF75_RHIMU